MDQALATQKSGDKPLCVVTDVDDTLILHPDYWGSMIATKHDAFDDPLWDEHIKHDKLMTVLVDTSNKEKVQKQIARDRTIAVYLGDSLNDFQRVYYVKRCGPAECSDGKGQRTVWTEVRNPAQSH